MCAQLRHDIRSPLVVHFRGGGGNFASSVFKAGEAVVVSWREKKTEICPQLSRELSRGCRF